jgi:hypothetical protein
MRRALGAALCLFALVVIVPSAGAMTVKRLTNEELTTQAELIVVGRHVESRSVWVGRVLVTRVTVAVGEILKGQAPSTVTVDIPGGIDMNREIPIGMSVPGAPTIHSGEHVVLFLSRQDGIKAQAGSGEYTIVGFSQGKFSVGQDAQGRQVVTPGAGRGAKRPLEAFKAEIQRHISRQGVRERPSPPALPGAED